MMAKIDQQDVLIKELTTKGTYDKPDDVLRHEDGAYSLDK